MFIVAKRLTPLSRCLDMQPASIALGSTLVSQSEYPLYKMHNRVHKLNATVPICLAFDFIWLAVCLAALVSAALALHFAFQNDKSQAAWLLPSPLLCHPSQSQLNWSPTQALSPGPLL